MVPSALQRQRKTVSAPSASKLPGRQAISRLASVTSHQGHELWHPLLVLPRGARGAAVRRRSGRCWHCR